MQKKSGHIGLEKLTNNKGYDQRKEFHKELISERKKHPVPDQ